MRNSKLIIIQSNLSILESSDWIYNRINYILIRIQSWAKESPKCDFNTFYYLIKAELEFTKFYQKWETLETKLDKISLFELSFQLSANYEKAMFYFLQSKNDANSLVVNTKVSLITLGSKCPEF